MKINEHSRNINDNPWKPIKNDYRHPAGIIRQLSGSFSLPVSGPLPLHRLQPAVLIHSFINQSVWFLCDVLDDINQLKTDGFYLHCTVVPDTLAQGKLLVEILIKVLYWRFNALIIQTSEHGNIIKLTFKRRQYS